MPTTLDDIHETYAQAKAKFQRLRVQIDGALAEVERATREAIEETLQRVSRDIEELEDLLDAEAFRRAIHEPGDRIPYTEYRKRRGLRE